MIWNWHGDEVARIKRFTSLEVHNGTQPPQSDVIVMPECPHLNEVDKSKVILYPCIKDLSQLKKMGFKYVFAKDTAQAEQWGKGAIILPPIVEYIDYDKKPIRNGVALVHDYSTRDPKGYEMTKQLEGVIIAGYPDNPMYDIEAIKESRFLVHFKTLGYLCNSVIKSISLTTPVIFSRESYEYGYKDYLTDGLDCIVVDTIEQAQEVLNLREEHYNRLRWNLKSRIGKIQSLYPKAEKESKKMIDMLKNNRIIATWDGTIY